MIKIENTEVFGWEAAVRGCRNPKNSWDRMDSHWEDGKYVLGSNDLKLMHTLAKAGHDHGKFLRMIHVQVDVTGPLYWWKEADTYKVGTVADSCSTMHKIQAKKFTIDDFSHEHLMLQAYPALEAVIMVLNANRALFIEQKDKDYWWQMIQMLPSSYNQKRTWDMNYEVLRNIYFARKNHKLDEWHTFCDWIETLPYFKEICIED